MSLRDEVLHLLRVPHNPEPPPGSPPRTFRAAPNFFRLRLITWGGTQLVAVAGLIWAFYLFRIIGKSAPPMVIWIFRIFEAFGVIALIARGILGWMLVQLDYELRWYMLSDRAIRIREGITTIREKTIALANVQNISIRQGPLQRALGIADVEVKTAGGGDTEHGKKSMREPMHVAYFRGVANATEIRDLVREGVQRQKNAGLGDPEEVEAVDATREVIVELVREARALRKVARGV
ncbi:MAG: PH domain-containing protein [Acidobacteriota bacterium]|nr:PH domain-containing protein [Acidobacteriota bacterium]